MIFKTADIQISFSASLVGVETSYVSLENKSSHKQHSYIYNTSYGSKLLIFLLCQKSLDIKIMFHEDILYCKYIKT